jgi:hypothetical protein
MDRIYNKRESMGKKIERSISHDISLLYYNEINGFDKEIGRKLFKYTKSLFKKRVNKVRYFMLHYPVKCKICAKRTFIKDQCEEICKMCYKFENFDDNNTRLQRQDYVFKALHTQYNHKFVFDSCIVGGKSKRRPDVHLMLDTHMIIIEVDEYEHREYTNELSRMIELTNDTNKFSIFIRFNIDDYVKDEIYHPSPWACNKIVDKNEWDRRINNLFKHFDDALQNIPTLHKLDRLYYSN